MGRYRRHDNAVSKKRIQDLQDPTAKRLDRIQDP